jgi:hypothetical protein
LIAELKRATGLMGVDHLVRVTGEAGPEPPPGEHCSGLSLELYT